MVQARDFAQASTGAARGAARARQARHGPGTPRVPARAAPGRRGTPARRPGPAGRGSLLASRVCREASRRRDLGADPGLPECPGRSGRRGPCAGSRPSGQFGGSPGAPRFALRRRAAGDRPLRSSTLGLRGGEPLEPAMRLETRVMSVRSVPAGTPLGYGGSFVTSRPSTVAVLPIGYHDGLRRSFSGRVSVLVERQGGPDRRCGQHGLDAGGRNRLRGFARANGVVCLGSDSGRSGHRLGSRARGRHDPV